METRVHHCPRCGAPIKISPNAWAVRCEYCKSDVSLLGPAQSQNQGSPRGFEFAPKPPPPPSLGEIRRHKATLPISMAIFGAIAPLLVYFLDRNDSTDRAPLIAVLASLAGFFLYGTERRLLACILSLPVGLVLLLKPFIRPVMYEGRPHSLDSETHYYFLIPGALMIAVFGWLMWGAIERRHEAQTIKDSKVLRIVSAGLFVGGLALSIFQFGGPTVAEVIAQYQPQGAQMRQVWRKFQANLPEPGKVPQKSAKLDPPPVWIDDSREQNNIEIIPASKLVDPDERNIYGDLYLTGSLGYSISWTGPKNPLSSSLLGDPAGHFPKTFQRAFSIPWLATYRQGPREIEVFVWDVKKGEIVASATAPGGVNDLTAGRKAVLGALKRATGGTFR